MMTMRKLSVLFALCVTLSSPFRVYASDILEAFTITTYGVDVRETTESSIQFKSIHNAYTIKLEPNQNGQVIFALAGIGYATTARVDDLEFGVKITGYHNEDVFQPTYSLDDVNKHITLDQDTLKFHKIYGSLPVWFDRQVDSVKLEFCNSMGLNVSQYLGIEDLRLVAPMDISENPEIQTCKEKDVMIAIDGSSSIEKSERKIIANELLDLVKNAAVRPDSNELCIMEFGTVKHSLISSVREKELVSAVKHYKRNKNNRSKNTKFTNWSIALDEAIKRQPDLFVLVTDGWSNWYQGQPTSFSAQYETLISKCNTIKENGTRILFITSGLDNHEATRSNLYLFLNDEMTHETHGIEIDPSIGLMEVDLVSMTDLAELEQVNLASVYRCHQDIAVVAEE